MQYYFITKSLKTTFRPGLIGFVKSCYNSTSMPKSDSKYRFSIFLIEFSANRFGNWNTLKLAYEES